MLYNEFMECVSFKECVKKKLHLKKIGLLKRNIKMMRGLCHSNLRKASKIIIPTLENTIFIIQHHIMTKKCM